MARAELPPSLAEIRNPQNLQSHIAALKALKHDIIGHEQRKELVVHHGVTRLMVRNLKERQNVDLESQRGSVSPLGHLSSANSSFEVRRAGAGQWTEADELRLQSVQIVTCLAHGGLAFAQPLVAAGVITPLLSQLSPGSNLSRSVVESLRAVNAIVDALATDIVSSPENSLLGQLATQLFARPTVDALAEIMSQTIKSMATDEQVTLVLRIICTCLRDSSSRYAGALVKAGVLDCICSRLATLVAEMGHTNHPLDPAFLDTMLPSPPRSSLRYMLEALAYLCQKSAYRSMRILYSKHLLEVFPISAPRPPQTPREYLPFSDQSSPPPANTNPLDSLLPKLQAVQSKNEHSFSKAFPALGSFVGHGEVAGLPYLSDLHTSVSSRTISADEFGSPLVAWLIHMARNADGLERLAALEFLARLISALDQKIMESWSESSRNRDRTLAFLVVPLLVRIISSADPKNLSKSTMNADESANMDLVRERAPLALAVLVRECPALQKAAYDASAVKVLCHMLKKSFDPVNVTRKNMWTPTPSAVAMDMNGELDDPSCDLGQVAMTSENIHRFRCRAASLRALAAIAQKEDLYRKMIIELHVMGCVVDSLIPYPDGPLSAVQSDAKEGNPWFVITGACRLATALSRSVGVLRTNLIDAGIAKPAFMLLKERDWRVRLAGTDVMTNLVLQFSPMREELVKIGVAKVLCEHAHSADLRLRCSALWALKHLCSSAPNDIRTSVLDELGTGWLIQVMTGEGSSYTGRSHMATSNAAGEQVDILNAIDEPAMDLDEDDDIDSASDDEDERMYINSSISVPRVPARHRARLRAIKQEEESPALIARRTDMLIQLQALDIVRNIISEAGPKQPDMIDHLLREIGAQRLFECLASKLKPRATGLSGKSTVTSNPSPSVPAGKRPTLTTPSAASSSAQDKERYAHQARIDSFPSHLYTDSEILTSTLFCLIHIGNGRPTHRHTLLNLTTSLPPHQNPATLFPSAFPARLLPQVTHPNLPVTPGAQSQYRLLDLILPLFWHPDPKIRVACCWMVHNIMWMEDQADATAARERALELRSRGFEDVVRGAMADLDLDVRERAKGCVDVWGRITGVGGTSGGEAEVAGHAGSLRGVGRSWER